MKIVQNTLLAGLLIIISSIQTNAAPPAGQTVTYSDFNMIRDIATSVNHVYFATTNGITVFNKFTEQWEDPLTSRYGIQDWDIHKIWVEQFDRNFYAETSTDLYEFDSLADRWYTISSLPEIETDDHVVAPPKVMFAPPGFNYLNDGRLVDRVGRYYSFVEMIEDGSGQYWIGTWGRGAATSTGLSGSIKILPFGLLQPRVNTIFMDHDGYLWMSGAVLGANRSGITIFDPNTNKFDYVESGIYREFPALDVNCITGNDETIYVGTEVGVLLIDAESLQILKRISSKEGLTDDNVLALAVLGDSIFVGTERGVNLVVPMGGDSIEIVGPTQLLDDIVYDLEIVDSTLWIAANSGAYRWTWYGDRLQQFQDPNLIIFSQCFSIERQGNFLWLASRDGLVRLNLKTGDTEPFRNPSTASDYRALAVNEKIAAMSSDRGMTILFYTNEKQIEREFTTDDGLPSYNVFDLQLDGDFIWIGTDKGLTRFWWNNPSRVD